MSSIKDLEFALQNLSLENDQSWDNVDQVFSNIVSSDSKDLFPSLQLVEDFLLQSLDKQLLNMKELKKSA